MAEKRVVYFDFLNIAACLCVIGMHCNGIVHRFELIPAWYVSLVVEVLGYWAVPGFLMLSGATMMNYRSRYDTRTFICHRLVKIGIPLIIWTTLFYLWKRYTGSITWTGWRAFLSMLLNFKVENVYWFFAPLITVYLSLPVLSCFADNRPMLRYLLLGGILTISVYPFACNLLGLTCNTSFLFPVMGGYLIYPVLGYYLHTSELKRWQKCLLYGAGILASIVRYGHTAWSLLEFGTVNKVTWGYTNMPALLQAASIFVLARDICDGAFFRKEKVIRWMRTLSGGSFGVYLIHVFVMNQLQQRLGVDIYCYQWLLIAPFAVYLVSLACVQVIRKIPGGKYVFP